jgi:NAD(P)-dependent dehydrogenase (short-subunit alcohol dehydrogenase family)
VLDLVCAVYPQWNLYATDSTTQGIGRQVAISFATEGCRKIALFDKNKETLGETKDIINATAADAEVQLWEVDNLDADEVIEHMTLAFKHFGRIDYAVNCAGTFAVYS